MSAAELLSFIPSLLYGVALAELFAQWRRFFDRDYLYWPYVITTVILTEVAIWNIYLFLVDVQNAELISYNNYWAILCQPILFVLLVHSFTPETEVKDTGTYFRKRMPIVFTLFAIYIGLHLIPGASNSFSMDWPRLIIIAVCLIIALSKYVPLVYVFGIIWLFSLFFR